MTAVLKVMTNFPSLTAVKCSQYMTFISKLFHSPTAVPQSMAAILQSVTAVPQSMTVVQHSMTVVPQSMTVVPQSMTAVSL